MVPAKLPAWTANVAVCRGLRELDYLYYSADSGENGPKQQAEELAPEEPAADPNGSDLGEERPESQEGRKMGIVL